MNIALITVYKLVRLLSLLSKTVCHIWLLFLPRLSSPKNGFLSRLSVGSRITWTVSTGSYLSQGINVSANFCFLQTLSIIFPLRLFVVSCFLPRLPSSKNCFLQTVPVILLPAETLSRKLNHTDSLCRKLFTKHNSLGRKQEIGGSLGRSQI